MGRAPDVVDVEGAQYKVVQKVNHPEYEITLAKLERPVMKVHKRLRATLESLREHELVFSQGVGVQLRESPRSSQISLDIRANPGAGVFIAPPGGMGGYLLAGIVVGSGERDGSSNIQLFDENLRIWMDNLVVADALGTLSAFGMTAAPKIAKAPVVPTPPATPAPGVAPPPPPMPSTVPPPPPAMPGAGGPKGKGPIKKPAEPTPGGVATRPATPTGPPGEHMRSIQEAIRKLEARVRGEEGEKGETPRRKLPTPPAKVPPPVPPRAAAMSPEQLYHEKLGSYLDLTNLTITEVLFRDNRAFLMRTFLGGLARDFERADGNFTMFVPTSYALSLLPVEALRQILERGDIKNELRNAHVVEGQLVLPVDEPSITFKTRSGSDWTLTLLGDRMTISGHGAHISVVGKPVLTRSGIVYYIDRPLLDRELEQKILGTKPYRLPGHKAIMEDHVYDKLIANERCSIFARLVQRANMGAFLRQTARVTLFALSDDSMQKVAEKLGYDPLLEGMSDDELRFFLGTFILPNTHIIVDTSSATPKLFQWAGRKTMPGLVGRTFGAEKFREELTGTSRFPSLSGDSIEIVGGERKIRINLINVADPTQVPYYIMSSARMSGVEAKNGSLIVIDDKDAGAEVSKSSKPFITATFLERFTRKEPYLVNLEDLSASTRAMLERISQPKPVETKVVKERSKATFTEILEQASHSAPIFVRYLRGAGRLGELESATTPRTLFIPTDSALAKLDIELFRTLETNNELRNNFVSGHIRNERIVLRTGKNVPDPGFYVFESWGVDNVTIYLINTPLLVGVQGDLARLGILGFKPESGVENNLIELLKSSERLRSRLFIQELVLSALPLEGIQSTPSTDIYLTSAIKKRGKYVLFIPEDEIFKNIQNIFISRSRFAPDDQIYMIKHFLARIPDAQSGLQPGPIVMESNEAMQVELRGSEMYLTVPGSFRAKAQLLAAGNNCWVYLLTDIQGLYRYIDSRYGYSRSKEQNEDLSQILFRRLQLKDDVPEEQEETEQLRPEEEWEE
jgi:hypothetical protein